jgi:hypothetical protein
MEYVHREDGAREEMHYLIQVHSEHLLYRNQVCQLPETYLRDKLWARPRLIHNPPSSHVLKLVLAGYGLVLQRLQTLSKLLDTGVF